MQHFPDLRARTDILLAAIRLQCGHGMKRREFIGIVGGAAAWSVAARAEQPMMAVVGFINSGSAEPLAPMVAGFQRGLSEAGYVEGRNLAIEFRWADNLYDRLPGLATDLVRRQVAVIAA